MQFFLTQALGNYIPQWKKDMIGSLISLFILVGSLLWLAGEGIHRLYHPRKIKPAGILIFGFCELIFNAYLL